MRKVKVEGLEEATKAFDRLQKEVQEAVKGAAVERAGEYVRQDAHDKCPVKGGRSADGFYSSDGEMTARSGAVRKSIKYENKGDFAVVGTNHIIAPDVEFGTSREKPHPFLRRSVEDGSTRTAIAEIYREEVGRAVRA